MAPEITAFLAALDETQYLPPPRMQAYQRRLLAGLLRHARGETEFYRDRLAPVFDSGDEIDWDRWQEIPVLTRSEAQANADLLRARSMPPAAGRATEDTSSGSTGIPFRHLVTDIQNLASGSCSERFFRWHGLEPTALTARIRAAANPEAAYPNGRPDKGWRIGHADSRVIDLSIAATTDQQLEWLGRIRPDYLISYPSNLRELARRMEEIGDQQHFDKILTFGEMVSEDTRAIIREHFGTEPLDRYGASEVGHIGGTCPHSLKLHVSAELVLLEILADDGSPAPPGSVGRVVVTSFYNLAMPLIRYELGDFAVLSPEPCGCGRTLPVLDRILGRGRNVFRFVDGSSVWPVLLSSRLRGFVPFRQFQIVQRGYTDVELLYVPERPDQTNDLVGLQDYVRSRLHPSIVVTASPVARIERSAGGKFEDCISLVTART